MDTILVTGGAGFIGGCFVRMRLQDQDCKIINLDKLTYAGNTDSLASVWDQPNHIFVQGDIGDGKLVARLLEEHKPRYIVNFAAESHVDRSIDSPAPFIETNVAGTCTLLEAVLHHWKTLPDEKKAEFRFLQVSTDEVYGSLGAEGFFTETTPYSPNSPYSASKASSDHFVRAFHETYKLPILISNCSNNYGPYQFPEKLIPLMTLNALEGRALPIYGDGKNVRDWLYVEDHCNAIWKILKGGRVGESYNIGGNSECTNLEIVDTICAIIDELRPDLPHCPTASLKKFVTDRPGHDRRYAIDATKIKNELGWEPAQTFHTGIRETIQWYLDNETWTERIASGSYQRERLGISRTA